MDDPATPRRRRRVRRPPRPTNATTDPAALPRLRDQLRAAWVRLDAHVTTAEGAALAGWAWTYCLAPDLTLRQATLFLLAVHDYTYRHRAPELRQLADEIAITLRDSSPRSSCHYWPVLKDGSADLTKIRAQV